MKKINLEEAAARRGTKVIAAPSIDAFGGGSPIFGIRHWLIKEHLLQPRDNVFVGDVLMRRLKDAERKFQGDAAAADFVDAQVALLEQSEGFKLEGDGLFIVRERT